MAKYKKLLNRIHIIESTRKITQAMKFVAMATLEKNKHKLEELLLYSGPLRILLERTMRYGAPKCSAPYFAQRPIHCELVILLASDKGLCGSFNHSILQAIDHYHQKGVQGGKTIHLLPIGKKAQQFVKKKGWHALTQYRDLLQKISFDYVAECSNFLQKLFLEGTYDQITILSQPSVDKSTCSIKPWLPMAPIARKKHKRRDKVIYEPTKQAVVSYLLPEVLACNLYEIVLHAQLGEHKSRMLAMSQATDNADTLYKKQKLKYNRLRQAMITQGIMELAAGLNA